MESSNQKKNIDQVSALKEKLRTKEEELKHFKEMYSLLNTILSNTIPFCMTDKDFNIQYVNRSYSEFYNNKLGESIGSKCYDNRPNRRCHTSECPLTRLKNEKLKKVEFECKSESNPKDIPLMVIARPFYDEKGAFAGTVETFHDIRSRKEAENALKEKDKFLNTIFDTIQDGISVLDKDLNIIKTNSAMEKMYPDRKIIGQKCYTVYHDRKRKCNSCPSIRSLESEKLEVEEIPLKMQNGETGILELFSFPMKDEEGKISGVVEYVRNITERRRAEESRINLVTELHNALSEVKVLRGILPLCSYCKKIRDDKGFWEKVDVYIQQHSEADVSHGICPDCLKEFFPNQYKELEKENNVNLK